MTDGSPPTEKEIKREPKRRCPKPDCGGPMVVEQTAYKGRLPQRDTICLVCGYRERTAEHVVDTGDNV